MDESYVKLFRKIRDSQLWHDDPSVLKFFIYCLLTANWKDGWFRETKISRGSFARSLKNMSAESGLSIKQVRSSLRKLQGGGVLRAEGARRCTIVTVVNYETYQSTEPDQGHAKGTLGASKGQAEGTLGATIEEGKKERREEVCVGELGSPHNTKPHTHPSWPNCSEEDQQGWDLWVAYQHRRAKGATLMPGIVDRWRNELIGQQGHVLGIVQLSIERDNGSLCTRWYHANRRQDEQNPQREPDKPGYFDGLPIF